MTSFQSFQRQALSLVATVVFAGLALCAALPVTPVA